MFSLLLIYTINPTYNVGNIIGNVFKVLCAPLECIGKFYNVIANKLDQTFKLKKKQKRKIISYLIIYVDILYTHRRYSAPFFRQIDRASKRSHVQGYIE